MTAVGHNVDIIKAYKMCAREYIEKVTTDRSKRAIEYWPGVEKFLAMLEPEETVFEVGSGSGQDAKRIEQSGHPVVRTDVVDLFVQRLRAQGYDARNYDVLKDELPAYSAVFANAVFLHFDTQEFERALQNISVGLQSDGMLALGMKLGTFEGLRNKGLSAPRFFKFWKLGDLNKYLEKNGFNVVDTYVTQGNDYAIVISQLIKR